MELQKGRKVSKKPLGNLKQISTCGFAPAHTDTARRLLCEQRQPLVFHFGGGVFPSEPSQAVEEMKRLSREGQGKEARVGW